MRRSGREAVAPTRTPAVLVVGGGPAGSSLAALLARGGREVVLLEREAGPHDKVCGEFISAEAIGVLAGLGLDPVRLGAVPVDRLRLAAGRRAAETPLPFPALSLSRRRLDEALLGLAAEAGVQIKRGRRVKALEACQGGWRATLEGGESVEAASAFLATGKHDLRDRKRPAGLHGDLVGFKMHLRLQQRQAGLLDGAVELHLFPGGYAGLEPIEDGLANLCLVIGRRELGEGAWPALRQMLLSECPLLGERLWGAGALWPKPLAISAIPYGHVATASGGLWRIGDQAAVIPSFAGDGLGVALHSARAAAAAYLAGETPDAFQKALAADLALRVKGAALASLLLVQPWAQGLAVRLAQKRPQLLSAAAAWTRIPEKALARPAPVLPGKAGSTLPSDRRSDCRA